ncbi:hypothetical protein [Streptomyces poonensis]|nr:hypothetical protein [Streptomyces poonensis]
MKYGSVTRSAEATSYAGGVPAASSSPATSSTMRSRTRVSAVRA